MNKFKALFYYLSQGNIKVFGLILISAGFVIIARLLAPFYVGWDQGAQLEAAYRLVDGLGLTSTYFGTHVNNINIPPTPEHLTSWPPLFSLLAAIFLVVGIPLILSLKIIYTLTTILGWVGWGILGSYCLSRPVKIRKCSFPLQLLIAALIPVFYTPHWWGTDIFVWAAIPYVLMLLVGSHIKQSVKVECLVGAGLIFGLLYCTRYASPFVAIAAFFILLQMHFPKLWSFVKSYSIFFISSLVPIFGVSIYNRLSSNKALPSYANLKYGITHFPETLGRIFNSLSASFSLFGFPTFNKPIQLFVETLRETPVINYAVGIIGIGLVILLPILLIQSKKVIETPKQQLLVSLAILMASIPSFLIACMFIYSFDFLAFPRYYFPAGTSGIFIFYELATRPDRDRFPLKLLTKLYQSAFLFTFSFLGVLVFSSVIQTPKSFVKIAEPILGYSLLPNMEYPSNKIVTPFVESSEKVRALQQANPNAIFFVANYPHYIYDAYDKLRSFPHNSEFWKDAYVEKPVKVFWVFNASCPSICDPNDAIVEPLSNLPNLTTVATYPDEQYGKGTKIVVSDLPGGYQFK